MSFQVRALDLPLSWRSAATNEAADELGDRGSGEMLKVSSQLFRATIPSTREKKRSQASAMAVKTKHGGRERRTVAFEAHEGGISTS